MATTPTTITPPVESRTPNADRLRARRGGWTPSEMRAAHEADGKIEVEYREVQRAEALKKETLAAEARAASRARDEELRQARTAKLLKGSCQAGLPRCCTGKAERISMPIGGTVLDTPAWNIRVTCRACAVALMLA